MINQLEDPVRIKRKHFISERLLEFVLLLLYSPFSFPSKFPSSI